MIPQVGKRKREQEEAHKISIQIKKILSLLNRSVSVAHKDHRERVFFLGNTMLFLPKPGRNCRPVNE